MDIQIMRISITISIGITEINNKLKYFEHTSFMNERKC